MDDMIAAVQAASARRALENEDSAERLAILFAIEAKRVRDERGKEPNYLDLARVAIRFNLDSQQ